ncbi:type VI secretion system-associated protein TagF [Roseateles sp.]|uniref:type VI secretion system-associated protein TagF n=1 Tax=Roseateles sp. TaxID=1971397 RepID=UPI0039EB2EBD
MTDDAPGWYGKLAMLGDFASRRLAADCVVACDRWLAECVLGSQRALGEQWLSRYLAAPAWRFAWAPGVMDQRWWFGVLMPSCDNVGRYFPLLVAQPRAAPPADRISLDHLDLWWAQLVDAALATLAPGATLESFEAALEALPPWPGALPVVTRALPAAAGREAYAVAQGAALAGVVRGLAAAALQQRLAGGSFWWSCAQGDSECALLPGLPAADGFAAMLA